jgi:hypothetical protein
MIEKYLIPTSSVKNVDTVETRDESTETRAMSAAQLKSKENAPSAPVVQSELTCPYCGKPLSHDRSHCPLLRAKNPELVEKRIFELKQDAAENVDKGRENVIEILQGALLRIGGTKAKKGMTSNVNSKMTFLTLPENKPLLTIFAPGFFLNPSGPHKTLLYQA